MTRSLASAAPVYAAALFQGLALVSFPASSDVLKSADGLTDAQYGAIFLPQIVAAILGALGGGVLAERLGLKPIFVLALLANTVSQGLLALSVVVPREFAYAIVLAGTTFLGLGFGATGGALNTYPRVLFPGKAGTALLVLHSTTGVGLSVGPLIVGWLAMQALWLAFPIGLTLAGGALAAAVALAGLPDDRPAAMRLVADAKPAASPIFWLLAAIAVVYAFAEGTFSSWAVIFVREARGLPPEIATSALSAFWAALVLGRVLVSGVLLRFSPLVPWAVLPLVILAAFLFIPTIATPTGAVLGFALAGFGCSAFYPLTVATASGRFVGAVAFVSSMLTAALMFGSGAASFVVGGLRAYLSLDELYRVSAVYPVIVMALVAMTVRLLQARSRAVA
jgi:fucose permease